jgi:nuclear GTP-binding protein
MSLLKNYARSSNMKQSINVGIIGFPNVGKSSVINSLKRERAVNVGARAGVTTTTQEIILDKNVKLIDCPGIIFSSEMSESDAALRNCLNLDQLDDFTLPVQAILNRSVEQKHSEDLRVTWGRGGKGGKERSQERQLTLLDAQRRIW